MLACIRMLFLLPGGLLLITAGVRAQALKPAVTASVGLIETTQHDPPQPSFAFYPELEVATEIVRSRRTQLSLSGSLYAGGWHDGVETPSSCADCITYAYSSLIFGTRLRVGLPAFPLPLSFWGGVSRHLLFARYIAGADWAGNEGHDHRDAFNALEAGARLQVSIATRVQVGGEVQFYLPLPVSEENPNVARMRYGLAATYTPR